jgi:gas vesicle protein
MIRSIGGFLAGLGAGVGMGMLLAPREGRQTRSMVRNKAAEGASYLRQRSTDVRKAATDAIRENTRRVTEGTEAVKAAVNAGTEAYRDSLRS